MVFDFIAKHTMLEALLVQARDQLERQFGRDAHIDLKVVHDPEDASVEQLFGYIKTKLPVREALERLDNFDKAWFLGVLDQTGGLLNFDVEFV